VSAGVVVADVFPVGRCAACGREVLTHLDADLGRQCIVCDRPIDPAGLRWVSGAELGPLGFSIDGEAGGCGRSGCGGGGGCSR
jgi:hypothetical protein